LYPPLPVGLEIEYLPLMKTKFFALAIILVLIAATAWTVGEYEETALPLDPNVTIRKLDNGLTYYIRENSEPENRVFLRLVVNAGSILEVYDQLGLAHMAEHMAFNGTAKYEKSEIIDYLESIGMRFGPEINAYTSFDETVYMLQVPTDDPEKLDKGFDILSQWAFSISFENEEIDKERGVIVEEWRTGLGAQDRLREQQFPILFQNSRYANRLPIGDMDVIQSFEYDAIRRFYRDWYRPEHMAVIAAGDFDTDEIAGLIDTYFGEETGVSAGPIRARYAVPDHSDTLFALASDPELAYTQISVYNKADISALVSEEDYRDMLVHRLYGRMINARFSESSRSADPPFLAAGSGRSNLVRPKGINYLSAVVEGNNVTLALQSLLYEARRVKQFGFTQGELDRAVSETLTGIERAYTERDNAESESYMQEYTRHFLEGEAAPGIEAEFELYNRLVPEIGLEDINAIADGYLSESNRVILVSAVEKDNLEPVNQDEIAATLREVEAGAVTAYVDETSEEPLLKVAPEPGAVSSRVYHDEVDITEWRLSNGVIVYLKPTAFKNDEVRFTAFSPGGTSLYDQSDYLSARYASSLIEESGIGSFSATALEKKLAGLTVSVTPYIGTIEEGLRGMSSVRDTETLFKLIYTYFMPPREDSEAYGNLIRALETIAQNRESQPGRLFSERIQEILSGGHYTTEPLTAERVKNIGQLRAQEIFTERFSDAGDFTFVFVGNISPPDLETYLVEYIAALPAGDRMESWRDLGIERPAGLVTDTVVAGLEPKSQVITIFHGDYEWGRVNNHMLLSLADALRIRLREVLREDESGTYGVGVRAGFERFPKQRYTMQIYFGTSPDRAEELANLAMDTIFDFVATSPADLYLTKVKTTQREQFTLDIKENSYWVSGIKNAALHGRELSSILDYPELIDALDAQDIATAAKRYLDRGRYVRVILFPAAADDE
jgi:zinc protease